MSTINELQDWNSVSTEVTFCYDGSFNGFLTAVFMGFEQKLGTVAIQPNGVLQNELFTPTDMVITNNAVAKTVWDAIKVKSNVGIKNVYFAFLSEQQDVESLLYAYIRKIMGVETFPSNNFLEGCVLKVNQLAHKVAKEKQRLERSVRFQITEDDVYFSKINSEFNILPLLSKHFRSTYADQEWIIYDEQRNYGLYYNTKVVEFIGLDVSEIASLQIIQNTTGFDEQVSFNLGQLKGIAQVDIKPRICHGFINRNASRRLKNRSKQKKVS